MATKKTTPKKQQTSDKIKKEIEKKSYDPTNDLFGYRISKKYREILDELSSELGIAKNQVINQALLRFYQDYKKFDLK